MSMHADAGALHARRRTALVAALLVAGFELADPAPALATPVNRVVSNCGDDSSNGGHGPAGSLRSTILSAVSGDTIDMTGLSCGSIVLVSTITIGQNTLTLNGPGQNKMKIETDQLFTRLVNHTNTGTLSINDVTLAYGTTYTTSNTPAAASGACVYSGGTVDIRHSTVTHCIAVARGAGARTAGGGIYAHDAVSMRYSTFAYNGAATKDGATSHGGAATSHGSVTARYSSIRYNYAAYGGGLSSGGDAYIKSSTISGNSAYLSIGGIEIFSSAPAGKTATLVNSTISGNDSAGSVGGMFANTATIKVLDSTIAFNTAGIGFIGIKPVAPGLALNAANGNIALTLQSALIANNSYGRGAAATAYDLSTISSGHVVTISGNNNLVPATGVAVPQDAGMKHACPLLGPLRDNGGPTQTHALLSHSPAIDAGTNAGNTTEDQRGSGSDAATHFYQRVSGVAADIGAYEVQHDDIVFNSSLEGCVP